MTGPTLFDVMAEDVASANDGRVHKNGTATEKAAARSVAPLTGRQRIAVLRALQQAGERGLTGEEAATNAGIRQSCHGLTRLEELESDAWNHLAERTDRTRRNLSGRSAIVFAITAEGERVAAQLRESA